MSGQAIPVDVLLSFGAALLSLRLAGRLLRTRRYAWGGGLLSFAAATGAIKRAFRTLFYGKLLRDEAIRQVIAEYGRMPEVRRLIDFITSSERGVVGRDRE